MSSGPKAATNQQGIEMLSNPWSIPAKPVVIKKIAKRKSRGPSIAPRSPPAKQRPSRNAAAHELPLDPLVAENFAIVKIAVFARS